jgi:hypothetical protein
MNVQVLIAETWMLIEVPKFSRSAIEIQNFQQTC